MATAFGVWRPTVSQEIRNKPSTPDNEVYESESGSTVASEQEAENEIENQMSSQGDTASSFPPLYHFDSTRTRKERKHHYAFDVDDNGLDINGFILHTDKHKGKRQKFRVYLDSNENGRLDKNDLLIGRIGLKQKHASKGVGNLLDDGELGQLEINFNKDDGNLPIVYRNSDSNASMRGNGKDSMPYLVSSIYQMSFSDSSGADVSSIVIDCGCV